MNDTGSQWAVQQIAEFLSAISGSSDENAAISAGVEHVAEALEAEIAAFLREDEVQGSVGFSLGQVPAQALRQVAEQRTNVIDVPGVGVCHAIIGSVPDDPGSVLVVARSEHPFDPPEVSLMRSMIRVLGMTLRGLRTLDQERSLRATLLERQSLLERLARIQRSISHRAPLQEVLDGITQGAHELLGEDIVGLRLIDPDDPSQAILVSASGLTDELLQAIRKSPLEQGAGGRAILEERLVIIEDYEDYPRAIDALAARHLTSAMAAPVYQDGHIAGSLVVATYTAGRRYTSSEQEMLLALAEHASLALTDAKTLEEMREAQKTKDMFLAMVSHELKTPLTVIMGVTQTLVTRMDKLPEELRTELLQTAFARGRDLQRLIDMLLKGAQAQLAGRKDPSNLTIEVGRALRGFEASRDVVVADIPDANILVDRTALRQILGLLVENAISHSSPGSPVRVEVGLTDGQVRIMVKNEGELPPEPDLSHLFEPFHRGENASSSGVGLGLHVASKLAAAMEGSVSASSRDGWVTFMLTFPLDRVSTGSAEAALPAL